MLIKPSTKDDERYCRIKHHLRYETKEEELNRTKEQLRRENIINGSPLSSYYPIDEKSLLNRIPNKKLIEKEQQEIGSFHSID